MASSRAARRVKSSTRPALDVPTIARAGLEILDEDGLAGVTIRSVADRLGVTPMALSHHLPDKESLLLSISDAASQEPLPVPSGDGWAADLVLLARWMRRSMLRHPGLVDIRRVVQVWPARQRVIGERWLSLWERSGMLSESVVRASSVAQPRPQPSGSGPSALERTAPRYLGSV